MNDISSSMVDLGLKGATELVNNSKSMVVRIIVQFYNRLIAYNFKLNHDGNYDDIFL